jgi:hypothetical protein
MRKKIGAPSGEIKTIKMDQMQMAELKNTI